MSSLAPPTSPTVMRTGEVSASAASRSTRRGMVAENSSVCLRTRHSSAAQRGEEEGSRLDVEWAGGRDAKPPSSSLRRGVLEPQGTSPAKGAPPSGPSAHAPVWPDLAHDGADLWLKPHVEHAVRLVKHLRSVQRA